MKEITKGTSMVFTKPNTDLPSGRRFVKYLYIGFYVIITSAASVTLSITGRIPFDPTSALIAGIFAGFALVMFQLTYVKFIVKTSLRIKGESIDSE